ncbi:MAG: glutaredoxin family protein [Firmicutes bacterium]|jgi:glutaredoxin-like YruB-family protein|nr:glutaredoxin family protein [Bacillota bacterium]
MKKIIIYASNTCPYCTLAKEYFEEKNLKYEERNIHNSPEARKELLQMGYRGVPVILIDGEEILGFDKEKIEEVLAA